MFRFLSSSLMTLQTQPKKLKLHRNRYRAKKVLFSLYSTIRTISNDLSAMLAALVFDAANRTRTGEGGQNSYEDKLFRCLRFYTGVSTMIQQ
mmetsp:Transcript_21948/g.54331  ORF Transcript_21948/g.54331 Transcript_21948/m.54331 type:complete len:92 (-) Transcript_21948:32-307(-)